jgi:hypothetical protein
MEKEKNVLIIGSPSIGEILGIMKRTNMITDEIKEDYISVTDLSTLGVNKIFQ